MGDISEFLRPKSDENNTETELEKSGNNITTAANPQPIGVCGLFIFPQVHKRYTKWCYMSIWSFCATSPCLLG